MQLFSILVWWLLITVIGLAAAPLTLKAFKSLPDRGYTLTKPLGLLLLGLGCWLIGLMHFSLGTIIFCLLLLVGSGWWFWKKYQAEYEAFLRAQRPYLILVELFFLALFLLFLAFRMYNPDVLGTEKFMDLAFMNSLTRASSFPPYDPWLAGPHFSISYYYFGYLLMAIMTKLSGAMPAVAFNLALGLLFALAGISVFGLLYNLTRRLAVGFFGWAGIFMLGNLDGLRQVLESKTLENFNWWTPSRVIPDTINEFPFFSFLLGDMHPHMLSIPFVLVSLGLALQHLKSDEADVAPNQPERLARYLLWGLVVGSLGFINSWDLPTLYFLAVLVFFFQQYRQHGWIRLPWRSMLSALGVILAAAVVPYLPFYLNFHSQAKGLALTTQNTKVTEYLLIYGALLFAALAFVVARYHTWFSALAVPAPSKTAPARRRVRHCPHCGTPVREGKRFCGQCGERLETVVENAAEDSPLLRPAAEAPAGLRQWFLFLLQPVLLLRRGQAGRAPLWTLAALALIALAAFFKSPFLALTLALLLAIVPLLLARVDRPETVFALCLLFTACLLTFGAEVLHIRDTFDPPLDRMNTVFKFYYQIWFLFGLAGAYGVFWTHRYSLRNPNWRAAWLVPAVLLVAGSLVYPYAATLIKTNHFANVTTLDGSFYLRNVYPADREGIEWLRQRASGTPVVLEATGGEYTDFARVSTFTGLPTVLGWAGHELQWRGNYDEPSKRIPDIDTLYTSLDLARVQSLLDQYRVDYVFVGTLERNKYPIAGLEKFGQIWAKVYSNVGGVEIYQRSQR